MSHFFVGEQLPKRKKKTGWKFHLTAYPVLDFLFSGELTIDCLDYKFLSNHTT